jgi:DNA invertase Pin-like site-specific DNA recombinase
MLVGYARVSTTDQDLTVQLEALSRAGCEKVFAEKKTGTNAQREQLTQAMEFVRDGDVLLVTRLDRFARSSVDLHNLVQTLANKGVGFRCTEQSAVDTTTIEGKLMLAMLGAVAEFETGIRYERQREGIDKAKAAGVYKGRKRTVDAVEVLRMLDTGLKPTAIAKALGISRQSVYRMMP